MGEGLAWLGYGKIFPFRLFCILLIFKYKLR